MRLLLTALFIALSLGIVGCFETERMLSSPDDSKVDVAYCGNWEFPDPDQPDREKVKLVIRNFDGKHYFVEWSDPNDKPDDDKTLRMYGWTGTVKTVTFAHLRNLPPDGSIPNKQLVLRIELKDNKLTLRQLREEFFKDHPMETDADFKQLVEDNLENAEMYDEHEVVGTRVAGK